MLKKTAWEVREQQANAERIERLLRIADDYMGEGETHIADLYRQLAAVTSDRDHWKRLADAYQRELVSLDLQTRQPAIIVESRPGC